MEDRRAHERLDTIEAMFKKHLIEHEKLEIALKDNVMTTKQIADNTTEIVKLVKGIKDLREFAVWATPLVIGIVAVIAWLNLK